MTQVFQPIAIVGAGCILPGCSNVAELWNTVANQTSQLTHAPAGDWRVPMQDVLSAEPGRYVSNRTWSDIGGYIQGFDALFDPDSTLLDPQLVAALDPVFQWSLYSARQALQGVALSDSAKARAGVVLGNLSYPTRLHNRYAEQEWLRRLGGNSVPDAGDVHAMNRFMSGLPAMLVAQGMGLCGGSMALDAACASGLYAIKLACDRLQDGSADVMLAGAVNAADQLFLHVGFSALQALSRSGQSRPFNQQADGLVPAEGAAFVTLKRLADAQASGDRILGVIRGIGLSNDGRSGGFLSPSRAGQERCMREALAQAGIAPSEVQYIECHATGTTVGDATEIASLGGVYGGRADLPIGSLKANLGHLITASGVAGLIKVLAAMEHGEVPATPGSRPLSGALDGTGLRVPDAAMPWKDVDGQRTAAVSSFGFGGNNAHLIVQQAASAVVETVQMPALEFAVVGLGLRTHLDRNAAAFASRVLGEVGVALEQEPATVSLAAKQLAFPPADLKQALGQQLILLDVLAEATAGLPRLDAERTGIYVGMQTDSEICRYGLRWRWPDMLRRAGIAANHPGLQSAGDGLSGDLNAAGVIGKMPNICANRLNSQLDIRGPGFAVSREELSGDAALEVACSAIRRGEIDVALVAAVDLCREEVHEAALQGLGHDGHAADAAVMLVLKSRAQAERDGDPILAILTGAGHAVGKVVDSPVDSAVDKTVPAVHNDATSPLAALGSAHAASGLLHTALGVLMLRYRSCIDAAGVVQPLLPGSGPRQVRICNVSAFGEQAQWLLAEPSQGGLASRSARARPTLQTYAAADRAALLARIRGQQEGGAGGCRLAIVASTEQAEAARARALQLLESGQMGDDWTLEGISYRSTPIKGALAHAFTGAAAAYPGMGRDLLLGIPELTDQLATRLHDMSAAVGWSCISNDAGAVLPFQQLAGSSFLCQLHMQLSRDVLGLLPEAAIGLSSGETNAMFAFGVWQDMDGLLADIGRSGLYTHALARSFDAVRAHWGMVPGAAVDWENYRVRVPVADLRAALQGREKVYLTIVNSPTDSVIGGDREACLALLAALGNPPAVPLGHDLAIHCAAVQPFEAAWRRLHTRPVQAVDGVRFYSNYLGGVYLPTESSVADALTGQALATIDFPKIVNLAWADGVRIFVEHGPRNGLSTAIAEILEGREHLAVSLDRPGVSSLVQAWRAAAQLWCAGVDVDLARLQAAGGPPVLDTAADMGPVIQFRLRPPPVRAVAVSGPAADVYVPPQLQAGDAAARLMPAAPPLPWLIDARPPAALVQLAPSAEPAPPCPLVTLSPDALPTVGSAATPVVAQPTIVSTASPRTLPAAVPLSVAPTVTLVPATRPGTPLALLVEGHRQMAEAHQAYLAAQHQAQQAFAASMASMQAMLLGIAPHSATPASQLQPAAMLVPAPTPAPAIPAVVTMPAAPAFPGPAFSRQQLEILAGGEISAVLGDSFRSQDHYSIQVRMPQPPLLLCDRVLGIDGAPHSMGQGTIWTETDVLADSWYLHNGRMPAGIFIESGQADLLLISWLGVDALNQGERAYRLLGCELVFHGDLPAPGDTLHYQIHVDGHAQQGGIRLFFFHYDCHVNGELRLSVRNGQAGFFSTEELANSAGVIWAPETAAYTPDVKAAATESATSKTSFTAAEVESYLHGDLVACFGAQFYLACTHTRTPATPTGRHNFLGDVTRLDFQGGPAGRGYLRVEKAVDPHEWFFDGHFKNDPCMPGTLMAEACLQAMAFYLAATGRTLRCDGWRFQPVGGQQYRFKCRGQVTPASRQIVYELFVDEITEGPMPILYAHVLSTVDGRKAFLCERLGLQLVPDWPLTSMPDYPLAVPDTRPLAHIGDFALDYRSLINCAWGQPWLAFGPGMSHYSGPRRSPRLPGPPYHFMSRITSLHGTMAELKAGARVTAIYDVEPDAWYFSENASATMPNCVLMEAALQPCGWLATYTLSRAASERELLFRNLDGESVQHREVTPADRCLTTEVELLSVSQAGDLIIEKFAVRCTIEGEEVLRLTTVFGFFPPQAMINQKGFNSSAADVARLNQPSEICIDLAKRPARLFAGRGRARLPEARLLMIDRISGYWPQGGAAGMGAIRTEKDVNPRDWFFKAHFFQDPVQPGSLGVEAMLQAIQAWMLLQDMDQGINQPRFEPINLGGQTEWHYRGQVTPERKCITVEFEATEVGRDQGSAYALGMARLWIDGLQIYQAPKIGMRIVAGAPGLPDGPQHGLADQLHLPAASLQWDSAGQCLNLPLNRYDAQSGEVAALDWEPLLCDWSTRMPGEDTLVRDLGVALIQRFVRRVVLTDPAGYRALRGRPVLYLANHQTAVESFLFLAIATTLADLPAGAIAKDEHRHTWMGAIQRLADLAMGAANPLRMLYFDRARQASMLQLLQEYGAALGQDPYSLLVHVDGTRAQSAGVPVRAVSAVLIDLALKHDVPIVPVRFAGGLAAGQADQRLDFPYQMGQQDYHIGAALAPDMLRALPYARRASCVVDAINGLGPVGQADIPLAGDSAYADAVLNAMARGRGQQQAVLHQALASFAAAGEYTRRQLKALPQQRQDEATQLLRGLLG